MDVNIMFKPFQSDLYGPHVAVFGYAEVGDQLVDFRCRQGLDNDGSALYTSRYRTHNL